MIKLTDEEKRLRQAERCLSWKQRNREKAREIDAKYREKNKEKIKLKDAKRYAEKKEAMMAVAKKWEQQNREKVRARDARYRARNKEKISIKDARLYAEKRSWDLKLSFLKLTCLPAMQKIREKTPENDLGGVEIADGDFNKT